MSCRSVEGSPERLSAQASLKMAEATAVSLHLVTNFVEFEDQTFNPFTDLLKLFVYTLPDGTRVSFSRCMDFLSQARQRLLQSADVLGHGRLLGAKFGNFASDLSDFLAYSSLFGANGGK